MVDIPKSVPAILKLPVAAVRLWPTSVLELGIWSHWQMQVQQRLDLPFPRPDRQCAKTFQLPWEMTSTQPSATRMAIWSSIA